MFGALMLAANSTKVSLTWGDISQLGLGATAVAALTIQRDGDVTIVALLPGTEGADDWIVPRTATVGDGYEVRLTDNSAPPNPPTGAAVGDWIALTANRTWTLIEPNPNSENTGNYTVEIRPTGGAVVASNTFSMTATNLLLQ